MNITFLQLPTGPQALIESDEILIRNHQDAIDLMMNCSYQGANKLILREQHFVRDFFDLKTRIAGEILQKFSTYQCRLAIIGDFSAVESKSLRDFIYESNKGKTCGFVSTLEEASAFLSR